MNDDYRSHTTVEVGSKQVGVDQTTLWALQNMASEVGMTAATKDVSGPIKLLLAEHSEEIIEKYQDDEIGAKKAADEWHGEMAQKRKEEITGE